jgi:hypothetical protein
MSRTVVPATIPFPPLAAAPLVAIVDARLDIPATGEYALHVEIGQDGRAVVRLTPCVASLATRAASGG